MAWHIWPKEYHRWPYFDRSHDLWPKMVLQGDERNFWDADTISHTCNSNSTTYCDILNNYTSVSINGGHYNVIVILGAYSCKIRRIIFSIIMCILTFPFVGRERNRNKVYLSSYSDPIQPDRLQNKGISLNEKSKAFRMTWGGASHPAMH